MLRARMIWEKLVFHKKPTAKRVLLKSNQKKKKIWFSKGLKDLENNLFTIFFWKRREQFYSSTRFWFSSINVKNMIWTLQSKSAVLSVLNQTLSQCYPKSLRERKKCFFVHFERKSSDYFWPSKVTCQDKDFVTNKSLLPKSLPKLVALPTSANQLLFAVLTYYIPTRQVPLPEPRLA